MSPGPLNCSCNQRKRSKISHGEVHIVSLAVLPMHYRHCFFFETTEVRNKGGERPLPKHGTSSFVVMQGMGHFVIMGEGTKLGERVLYQSRLGIPYDFRMNQVFNSLVQNAFLEPGKPACGIKSSVCCFLDDC